MKLTQGWQWSGPASVQDRCGSPGGRGSGADPENFGKIGESEFCGSNERKRNK